MVNTLERESYTPISVTKASRVDYTRSVSTREVLKKPHFFFFVKDYPQGHTPVTTNRQVPTFTNCQAPTAANRQPLFILFLWYCVLPVS